MRRAAKVDVNQAQIVAAFRALGCSVKPAHAVGEGFPDLVIGYRGNDYLVEVKAPKGKLTPQQDQFRETWRGGYHVARSTDDAIQLVESWRSTAKQEGMTT